MTTTQSNIDLTGKHCLTINDFSVKEIKHLLQEAHDIKYKQKKGIKTNDLEGKTLGMIFEKASTRTRVSFEVGMQQLGGQAIFLNGNDMQLNRGESTADTAKVLSRYVDGLMIRTFEHETIEAFAENADVPVINGLTDPHHPTQVLADLMTIEENKGNLNGLKMAFIGDGNNNMTHSLMEGAAKVGMDMVVASPKGYEPNAEIMENAQKEAQQAFGATISLTDDPQEAVYDADVIVTDVWASMGDEAEEEKRKATFAPYQVNDELCQSAKDDFIFLHCLPAHRGEEVTASIIDGKHSVVFDEAENRLHAQKALMKETI
ncbi:ornithine carbamoyltransferase [Texcoconibacillus texcoconensis]|uniref:Ornithine carbamoyltransferase n=1 Tax=Texcoconibacillus texcoconensis TaxID=1095777 RepID=A0A840QS51_9BACI|nr:ornithine carbamoyltransferase [Texcoconibacillus texcoconensis]MBB5174170.1 ornithine carbamoyltransferase [Texcoconibacillus texcoconensis]